MHNLNERDLFVVTTAHGPAICTLFPSMLTPGGIDIRFHLADAPWMTHESRLVGPNGENPGDDDWHEMAVALVRTVAPTLDADAKARFRRVRTAYAEMFMAGE